MESKKSSLKILMFPWLAYGHITPFLELAKKLSENNLEIWFCSNGVNLENIKSKLPLKYSIQFVELKLPSLPLLPDPNMHTTNGLPLHLKSTLHDAFDMSASHFHSILHQISPDLLITEIDQPWAIQSANSLNIPVVLFFTFGLGASTFYLSFINPDDEFPFPELDLQPRSISTNSDSINNCQKLMRIISDCSNVVLLNSFEELEGTYIEYFSTTIKKKAIFVGPLVHKATDEKSDWILEWLDEKEPRSTVYVSFGSEYYLSKKDMEELTFGLEMSGANFVWVVRFAKGEEMRIEEAMPDGFLERVGERGIVVTGWAPQFKILNHSSVGGFVSHCGWNSVVEAVVHGVPIIALPELYEQPLNAAMAVSAGVAVKVERGVDGAIQRRGLTNAIKQVMFEKIGEDLNHKGKEICENLKAKKCRNIQDCVTELRKLCEVTKTM